jgi:mannosyltransferase
VPESSRDRWIDSSEPDSRRPQDAVFVPGVIATVLTTAAVLSAVGLRWFHLGKLSLWWDEGFTAWQSGLSPAELLRFARSDTYPPLYFFLQRYWAALFGNSEYALRALSALFGTLSVPVFYLLAKKVLRDSLAVALAMWLFAFSMMQVWYSREARSYELASFLALVSLYALVLFLERRSLLLFASIVLSVAASLYMHNMMFFYLLALNVTWLIYPSERTSAERLKELLLADILAGVLFLPWASSLLTQIATVGGHLWWVSRPTVSNLVQTLSIIAGFDIQYLSWLPSRLMPLSEQTAWVWVVAGTGFLCAALVGGGFWRVPKADSNRNLSLLLYCLLPIVVVFVLSQKGQPLYIERVFTASSVVAPIVLAYPLALQRGAKGGMLYGFLGIVLAATTALSAFGFLRYQEKENWRDATNSLLRIPEGNRLIVFVPPAGQILFDYYSQRSPATDRGLAKIGLPASFRIPAPPARITGPSDLNGLKLAVESRKYSEIDLVLAHENMTDPRGLALDCMNGTFVRYEEQRFYGVRIVRFRASRPGSALGE